MAAGETVMRLLATRILISMGLVAVLATGLMAYGAIWFGTATIAVTALPLGIRLLAWVMATGLVAMGAAAAIGSVLGMRWRVTRSLNAALGALGLTGRPFQISGRQYHGETYGRPSQAFFYRGPHADWFLEGNVRTRGNLVPSNALARRLRGDGALPESGFLAFLPPEWAIAWHGADGVPEAVSRLLSSERSAVPSLFARPDGFMLRLHGPGALGVSKDEHRQIFDDLLTLIDAAEPLTPPEELLPSAAEARREPHWGVSALWMLVPCAFIVGMATLPMFLLLLPIFG